MNNVEMSIYLIDLDFILKNHIESLEKYKNEIYSSIYKLGIEKICSGESQKIFKNIDSMIYKIKELRIHIKFKNKNLTKEDLKYFQRYVDSVLE